MKTTIAFLITVIFLAGCGTGGGTYLAHKVVAQNVKVTPDGVEIPVVGVPGPSKDINLVVIQFESQVDTKPPRFEPIDASGRALGMKVTVDCADGRTLEATKNGETLDAGRKWLNFRFNSIKGAEKCDRLRISSAIPVQIEEIRWRAYNAVDMP